MTAAAVLMTCLDGDDWPREGGAAPGQVLVRPWAEGAQARRVDVTYDMPPRGGSDVQVAAFPHAVVTWAEDGRSLTGLG